MNPISSPQSRVRATVSDHRMTYVVASLLSLSTAAFAGPFTAGNLVVIRAGDGSTTLGNTATPAALVEFTTSAGQSSPVQSIAIDSTASGLTLTGTSTTQGILNSSPDGSLLTFTGYRKAAGGPNPQSDSAATTNRVVGVVNPSGSVNVSTAVTDAYNGDAVRGAVTTNGGSFYLSGAGSSASGGIRYVATAGGATTSTALNNGNSGNPNTRQVSIVGGNLFTSSGAGNPGIGLYKIGTGLPVSGPQAYTSSIPAGTAQYNSFFFTNLGSGNNWAGTGFDTAYTADTNGNLLAKWSFNGSVWSASGTVPLSGVANITGVTSGSNVTLYGTTGATSTGILFSLSDTTGFNGNLTGSPTTLATAGTNYAFRGVSFVPQTVLVTQPDLTVSVVAPATASTGVNFDYTLTVSNIGGASATGVAANFNLPAGLTFVSASGSNGFSAVNNSGTVEFTGGSINASSTATLTVTVSTATAATYTAPIGAAVADPANTIAEISEANNSSTAATSTIVSAPVPTGTVSIGPVSIAEGNSSTSILSLPVSRTNNDTAFTINYAVTGGTATSGSDFAAVAPGTLTFTAGGPATQNIEITINGDTSIEVNETITVTLSGISSSTGVTTVGTASANGTITNDDVVPVTYPASGTLTSTLIGSIPLPGSEIPAFDPASKRAFASSAVGVQVVNLSNPAAPASLPAITPGTLGVAGLTSNDVSSIAVRKGTGGNPNILAAAIINNPKTNNGHVIFLNAATGALIGSVTVGVVPDHIAFTPDGTKLLVCNEGELSTPQTTVALAVPDAAQGSVSIVSVAATGIPGAIQTANFSAFDAQTSALKAAGVRIFDDGVPSTDFEPEYLAISPDGTKAMVTLQEANALAILDIGTATFTSVVPLGEKDFALGKHDFSDQDGAGGANLANPTTGNPVFGLYMPDAIASYQVGGQTYYVTANEGDDRNDFLNPDESTTVADAGYNLDDTAFPTETTLKTPASLGRLVVSNLSGLRGDTDPVPDGDIDRILSYGGRSFSIHDSTGARVFDSGDMVEMIVASQFPAQFFDGRSDNKGPEPEGVTVAKIGARTFAFVGLERSHMVLAFDVTNPLAPTFATAFQRTGDTNPEGMVVVEAADSPTGKPLLLVSSEDSNTLTVFEIGQPTDFKLQLLHLADAEAGLLASSTAPNLAALVDAFDGTYPNTLILAGGDNYIPGPFAAAGTDAAVALTHNKGNNPFAADIEIHNRIGVEASTIGNHEFDFGTNAFSDAINDTTFPYLSSNLNFSGDSAFAIAATTTPPAPAFNRYVETVGVGGLEEASSLAKRIAPSCVVTKGTEKIGLVGVTTQIVEGISSTGNVEVKGFVGDGLETNDMVLLASQLQPVIDDLRNQGVDKIVLMAHLQQITFEQQLAPLLSGVDIILAAGSNTRLGDSNDVPVAFTGHAADFAGNYPIYTAGADGLPTVIVNTDNEFTYLGRLVADFDADGVLIVPNLTANIVENGAYAATDANVAAVWNTTVGNLPTTAFAAGTKGALVKQITDAVQGVISVKDGDIRGFTDVYLEGERNFVRNQETNLGDITADSMIAVAKTALPSATHVVAMKNGGGIRTAIGAVDVVSGAKLPPIANPGANKPAGAISLLDIENSLRFNNGLMLCETSPAGLKAILEHGVAVLGNQGRFPQIGGIRFSYIPNAAVGSKIQSIVLVDENDVITARVVSGRLVRPDAPAIITLVTLNFLAGNAAGANTAGGDGYPFKVNADNFRYLLSNGTLSAAIPETENFTAAGIVPANLLGEQLALSNYLQARYATPATAYDIAETVPALDTRIQSTAVRTDTVLAGPATFTAWLALNGYTSTGIDTDTDGDGLKDRVEYFFNLNPNNSAIGGNLPAVVLNGTDRELRFSRLTSAFGIDATLHQSSDLQGVWPLALPGVDYEIISETSNGEQTDVSYRLLGSQPAKFFRFEVK